MTLIAFSVLLFLAFKNIKNTYTQDEPHKKPVKKHVAPC